MAFEAYAGISAPHFFLGHYDQALDWAERALREKPWERLALFVKVVALAMKGSRSDEPAGVEWRRHLQQLPRPTISWIMQRMVLSRSRDRELVETALRKAGYAD
jgi:hypothetical protein